jgi:D-serine dehydratase
MKNAASLVLLATALAFTGCNTQIGVDNPDTHEASFSNILGTLTTRYNADTESVFNAVKRTFDGMSGTLRTGETDERGANNELLSVKVFARTVGDLEISVDVAKTEDPITKQFFTQVTVKYGNFGNLPQSQQIISKISSNLRR